MKLVIRYFASLREALGPGETLDWAPAANATAGALREYLRARSDAAAAALAPGRAVRIAIDQAMATEQSELREGAEVAFFPPVTGG